MSEEMTQPGGVGPVNSSPRPSISTVPLPRRSRSLSQSSDFPPPMRRRSSEANRPFPFSAKFQKVHPGTTGVTVLEHLERLDAVEASLQRLGVDGPLIEEEDEEVDVGEASMTREDAPLLIQTGDGDAVDQDLSASTEFSPPASPNGVTSLPGEQSLACSMTEEDWTAMSRSMSHVEPPRSRHVGRDGYVGHSRRLDNTLEWIAADEAEQRKRTVVVEVSAQLPPSQIESNTFRSALN